MCESERRSELLEGRSRWWYGVLLAIVSTAAQPGHHHHDREGIIAVRGNGGVWNERESHFYFILFYFFVTRVFLVHIPLLLYINCVCIQNDNFKASKTP